MDNQLFELYSKRVKKSAYDIIKLIEDLEMEVEFNEITDDEKIDTVILLQVDIERLNDLFKKLENSI